jgi:hypothetical protein
LAEILGLPIGIALQIPWMIIFMILTIYLIVFYYQKARSANIELKRLNSVNEGKLINELGEVCKGV